MFTNIVERVNKKMKEWKDKSSSQAEKEVLIKTVIQAILAHTMNFFLLPIMMCQENEKATIHIFLGNIENTIWDSWEVLRTPKTKGEIGFG